MSDGEGFGQQHNNWYVRDKYDENFSQKGKYKYCDYNAEFGGDLGIIKLKILAFQGKNDLEVYLE